MRAVVTPHTIQELHENYEAAIAWLSDIGFGVELGRVSEYRQVLRRLSLEFTQHGWGDLNNPEHRGRVFTALLEIREITSIYIGHSSLSGQKLSASLKHYLKGPFLPENESAHNSSNRARNIGFELYLNALFSSAGLAPTYEGDADLTFMLGADKFYVEAKRPMNIHSVRKSLFHANSQLSRRLHNTPSESAYGIIAIDLTKVINPNNKLMPVSSEDHLYSLMYAEDKLQIEKLKEFWHRSRDERTIAVIMHYRLLANFVNSGALNTVKWLGFVQLSENYRLDEISSKLSSVVSEIC